MSTPSMEKIINNQEVILNELFPKSEYEGSFITAENCVDGLYGKVKADENVYITVCNKNLLDFLSIYNVRTAFGITTEIDDEDYLTVTGTPTQSYINILQKTSLDNLFVDEETYILNAEIKNSASNVLQQIIGYGKSSNSNIYISPNKQFTVDKSNYNYSIIFQTSTNLAEINYKARFMLLKIVENLDTDYIRHKEQNYNGTNIDFKLYDGITHIYNTDDVNMTATVRQKNE